MAGEGSKTKGGTGRLGLYNELPDPTLAPEIVNEVRVKAEEAFPTASVTVIVQFEYVAGVSVLKVIVLLPETAVVVEEEQEPP